MDLFYFLIMIFCHERAELMVSLVIVRQCAVFLVFSCWQRKLQRYHDCQSDAAPLRKGITALLKIDPSELCQMLNEIYWILYEHDARILCILVVRKQCWWEKNKNANGKIITFGVFSWHKEMKYKRKRKLLKNRIYCQENVVNLSAAGR